MRPTAVVADLGRRLRELDYDSRHLRGRLGRVPDRLTPAAVAVARRRAGEDQLGTLIRFWCLGLPTTSTDLGIAFGTVEVDDLATVGLVEPDGDGVVASVRISPALGELVVHDIDRAASLTPDHVLGVGAATRTLASLTPRVAVKRALDIGTGCGIQALLLQDHAKTVVATDVSERAAWMAALSATMNGSDGIDIRTGDGLAPVAAETFDLIVSNPPFVISPDSELVFRDSGVEGDDLSRELVRDLVPLLRPGGTACVLINWIVHDDEGVTAAPEAWLSDLGSDALLLHHDSLDPLAYAQRWSMLPAAASAGAHEGQAVRWLAEFERLGARAIASGAIVLRRSGHGTRIRVIRMPKRPAQGGEQVERMLGAVGRFTGVDDPGLLTTLFRLIHGHRIDQRLHYGHGSYDATPVSMRLDHSAGVVGRIPADMLEAVFLIDGQRRLLDIATEIAEGRDIPTADVSTALVPVVLELFELGFLEIVEPG